MHKYTRPLLSFPLLPPFPSFPPLFPSSSSSRASNIIHTSMDHEPQRVLGQASAIFILEIEIKMSWSLE